MPVTEGESTPVFELILSGQKDCTPPRISLHRGETLTVQRGNRGSQPSLEKVVQVALPEMYDKLLSQNHATLRCDADSKLTVTDLETLNGTYINGKRIAPSEPMPLEVNDRLLLGHPGGEKLKASEVPPPPSHWTRLAPLGQPCCGGRSSMPASPYTPSILCASV